MGTFVFKPKNAKTEIAYDELVKRWSQLSADNLLEDIFSLFGSNAAIGTSFQKTGVVTIDITARVASDFRVFTIDTGRLFQETHAYLKQVADLYKIDLEVYRTDETDIQNMIVQSLYREYLFLESQRLRELCCYTRKVLPRNKALQTVDVWISGLRQDQSKFRSAMPWVDLVTIEGRPIIKVLPLFNRTEQEIDAYIEKHAIPLHPLYAEGYKTIGCQLPCSTPSIMGESDRAGRWRWEQDTKRECALHLPKYLNGGGI